MLDERRSPAVGNSSIKKGGAGEMTKASIGAQDLRRRIYIKAISHITLEVKLTGKRSGGNPHAAFERAGTGDGLTERLVRRSQRKRGVTDRSILRGTAPVLDPTDLAISLAAEAVRTSS
jgi:hypothetical protein